MSGADRGVGCRHVAQEQRKICGLEGKEAPKPSASEVDL